MQGGSGRKQATPHSVDGVCGNENLVELWAGKFKNLLTFSNPNSSRLLAQALVDLEVSVEDMTSGTMLELLLISLPEGYKGDYGS